MSRTSCGPCTIPPNAHTASKSTTLLPRPCHPLRQLHDGQLPVQQAQGLHCQDPLQEDFPEYDLALYDLILEGLVDART